MEALDHLDQRIVAALQVDGRASWRKIAVVLGEPERSVARRGTDLLTSGKVGVAALRTRTTYALMRLQCAPGTAHAAAEALAQRHDTTFSYVVTGEADCVAEVGVEKNRLGQVLGHEIPATIGVVRVASYPILKHFRTVRGWRAPVLTDREAKALQSPLTVDLDPAPDDLPLSQQDEAIVAALVHDGRAPAEAVARRAGVSETTATRRIDLLIRTGRLQIRAIVEPARLGLPVEALLWITTSPGDLQEVGRAMGALPEVRYAAAVAGRHQLVADVTVADPSALYDFMTSGAWAAKVHNVEATMLISPRKRGGVVLPRLA